MKLTLLDKIWNDHIIDQHEDGRYLLHVDRHLIHEVSSPQAFSGLQERGLKVKSPNLTFAVEDHIVATINNRTKHTEANGTALIDAIRKYTAEYGIQLFNLDDPRQGIMHVIAPELGLVLPGLSIVCGDSHTCSLGALGALAWGIGTSEVEHVLSTQTIWQEKPKKMRVSFNGKISNYLTAKDLILYLIGQIGVKAGMGHAIEYGGNIIESMTIEERLTICNLSIELGAKYGLIAPDQRVFDYLKNREYCPRGENWETAEEKFKNLYSDTHAVFDKEIKIDVDRIEPQITWGTTPQQVVAISENIPDLGENTRENREQNERAMRYMGLKPGQSLRGLSIDAVFIGSCTNGRLSDLRLAAGIVKGKKVAPHVRAIVVPGSKSVKYLAEQENLDQLFLEAGFEWREPGCSMCVGLNSDKVKPYQRVISTSNRNFEGRQGPYSRTHLASPAVAAACAVAGMIVNPKEYN